MSMLSVSATHELGYRAIDWQMAKQIVAYEQAQNPSVDSALLEQMVLEVSQALSKGQVCVPLSEELSQQLLSYAVVHDAQSTTEYSNQPLVLAYSKLYLARYYAYEQNVLEQIILRLQHPVEADLNKLHAVLQELFPTLQNTAPDWQKVAAASACLQNFNVITGGPGTGKTTTVTKLLSALLALNPDLHIALAAPTGKAAARMTESIRQAKQQLSHLLHQENIPDSSFTLHRLLGWTPRGFRYHANQHLPYECVVVDEASMIDLPMMSHLLSALSPKAKLILLGDRDQLASVEVGSVLADLCDAGVSHGPSPEFAAKLTQVTGYDVSQVVETQEAWLQNAVAQLRVSYRFHADSGIGNLARAVNEGNSQTAQTVFSQHPDELTWLDLNATLQRLNAYAPWQSLLLIGFEAFSRALQNYEAVTEVFAAFNQFQLLVALRKGVYGVEQINEQITSLLQHHGLVERPENQSVWYHGRPIMVSNNDYDLNLFNGDIGITLRHEGKLRVAFLTTEGSVRWLLPSRLPSHETAFAMTVHKSQGSEFNHVALLLPQQHQQVISRELIYTAITRAKQRFTLLSNALVFQQGMTHQVQRAGGLRDILWPKKG